MATLGGFEFLVVLRFIFKGDCLLLFGLSSSVLMAIWVGGKLAFLFLEHRRSRFDVDRRMFSPVPLNSSSSLHYLCERRDRLRKQDWIDFAVSKRPHEIYHKELAFSRKCSFLSRADVMCLLLLMD